MAYPESSERDLAVPYHLRILAAVQNEISRCGLGTMLESLPGVGETTASGDAVEIKGHIASGEFDVLVVSWDMPAEITGELAAQASSEGLRVLLLLSGSDKASIAQASEIASDGFLLQEDLTRDALDAALSRLFVGEMPMPARLARELLSHVRESRPKPRMRPVMLTPREHDVLALIAQGLSNKQIAHRLSISEHGAKRHVANVLAKLNCPNRTLAVVTAMREGLIANAAEAT